MNKRPIPNVHRVNEIDTDLRAALWGLGGAIGSLQKLGNLIPADLLERLQAIRTEVKAMDGSVLAFKELSK